MSWCPLWLVLLPHHDDVSTLSSLTKDDPTVPKMNPRWPRDEAEMTQWIQEFPWWPPKCFYINCPLLILVKSICINNILSINPILSSDYYQLPKPNCWFNGLWRWFESCPRADLTWWGTRQAWWGARVRSNQAACYHAWRRHPVCWPKRSRRCRDQVACQHFWLSQGDCQERDCCGELSFIKPPSLCPASSPLKAWVFYTNWKPKIQS